MKKFLAIVLALATVFSLCACGGGGGNEGSSGGKDASGNVTIKIGVTSKANVMSFEENALTKWLEAETGYNLEFVEYSGGTDVATQISSTIAARQELPDVLWMVTLGESVISTYGKEGYFVDLTPYYEDKEGASATFWTRLEECLTEEQQTYVVEKIHDNDTNGIYGVPTVQTSIVDTLRYMPWINTKWLETLGLSAPTNTQELYDVLVAFRDRDPNGNGKADEIPLFGSQKYSSASWAINWLINMFIYYDEDHPWQDYDGDGDLEYVYTQEKYREALQFINKLYDEKLLTSSIYTMDNNGMKSVVTPANNVALCGIFCGHLTTCITNGSELLYDYAALKNWGYAVERDVSYGMTTYITETAEKKGIVDECFNLLMTMWSKEGSLRIRYGEKGVNWVDPTSEDAVSDYGLKADYLLIDDPFTKQTTAMWGNVACTLVHYAEGETAEISDGTNEWVAAKSKMHAEARRLFDETAEEMNPKVTVPTMFGTTEESEAIDAVRTNVKAAVASAEMAFVCGSSGMDIDDDADWAAFQKQLEDLGVEEYRKYIEMLYARVTQE